MNAYLSESGLGEWVPILNSSFNIFSLHFLHFDLDDGDISIEYVVSLMIDYGMIFYYL